MQEIVPHTTAVHACVYNLAVAAGDTGTQPRFSGFLGFSYFQAICRLQRIYANSAISVHSRDFQGSSDFSYFQTICRPQRIYANSASRCAGTLEVLFDLYFY
jgi:hypothetical protein